MAKRSLIEQLGEAIEAILGRPVAPVPPGDPRVAGLLEIAAELRHLPREDFRARLKSDLQRRGTMTSRAKQVIERRTVTPYLVAPDVERLVEFAKQAFGATELLRGGPGSAGGLHIEVRIGDSTIMMGGGGRYSGPAWPTALHLYVPDADAVYRRALEAGGVSLGEPVDQPYGDREAAVKDPTGSHWYIATHKGANYIPEGLRSVTPYLHPRGAEKLIEFLKQAFGAEEVAAYRSPEGVIAHAQVRIGDSIIEMGEAHGPWQPMPTTFYLSVEDADAVYERALQAGATSLSPPADQPYGARVGAVTDAFGNQWYVATHKGI